MREKYEYDVTRMTVWLGMTVIILSAAVCALPEYPSKLTARRTLTNGSFEEDVHSSAGFITVIDDHHTKKAESLFKISNDMLLLNFDDDSMKTFMEFDSEAPSGEPSMKPISTEPTEFPSSRPTVSSSMVPSSQQSLEPSYLTTSKPSSSPSRSPSVVPSSAPTIRPSTFPSIESSIEPSTSPTSRQTVTPSEAPTTLEPTSKPSEKASVGPSLEHTQNPSASPAFPPTGSPTTYEPTTEQSRSPSFSPTKRPSNNPTTKQSLTAQPSIHSSFVSSTSNAQSSEEPTLAISKTSIVDPTNKPSISVAAQTLNSPMITSAVGSKIPTRDPTNSPSISVAIHFSASPMITSAESSEEPTQAISKISSLTPSNVPSVSIVSHTSDSPTMISVESPEVSLQTPLFTSSPTTQQSMQNIQSLSENATSNQSSTDSATVSILSTIETPPVSTSPTREPSVGLTVVPSTASTITTIPKMPFTSISAPLSTSNNPTLEYLESEMMESSSSSITENSLKPSMIPTTMTEQPSGEAYTPSVFPSSKSVTETSSISTILLPSTSPTTVSAVMQSTISPTSLSPVDLTTEPSLKETVVSAIPTTWPTTTQSLKSPTSVQSASVVSNSFSVSTSGPSSAITTSLPSVILSTELSVKPSISPSNTQTSKLPADPTIGPSSTKPTSMPSLILSKKPSAKPFLPTISPSNIQSSEPSAIPTIRPSSTKPTSLPTVAVSTDPSTSSVAPTALPSITDTNEPSFVPTEEPSSAYPTSSPSIVVSREPSAKPSSVLPTESPSITDTNEPSSMPSSSPSSIQTIEPSTKPSSVAPTSSLYIIRTNEPSSMPIPIKDPPSVSPTSSSALPTLLPSISLIVGVESSSNPKSESMNTSLPTLTPTTAGSNPTTGTSSSSLPPSLSSDGNVVSPAPTSPPSSLPTTISSASFGETDDISTFVTALPRMKFTLLETPEDLSENGLLNATQGIEKFIGYVLHEIYNADGRSLSDYFSGIKLVPIDERNVFQEPPNNELVRRLRQKRRQTEELKGTEIIYDATVSFFDEPPSSTSLLRTVIGTCAHFNSYLVENVTGTGHPELASVYIVHAEKYEENGAEVQSYLPTFNSPDEMNQMANFAEGKDTAMIVLTALGVATITMLLLVISTWRQRERSDRDQTRFEVATSFPSTGLPRVTRPVESDLSIVSSLTEVCTGRDDNILSMRQKVEKSRDQDENKPCDHKEANRMLSVAEINCMGTICLERDCDSVLPKSWLRALHADETSNRSMVSTQSARYHQTLLNQDFANICKSPTSPKLYSVVGSKSNNIDTVASSTSVVEAVTSKTGGFPTFGIAHTSKLPVDEMSSSSSDTDNDAVRSVATSASQFIRDLVWLENKIAMGNANVSKTNLDELESRVAGGNANEKTAVSVKESGALSVACKDCYIPSGDIVDGLDIETTADGPTFTSIAEGSLLRGHLSPGSRIVAVDDIDTSTASADLIISMITSTATPTHKVTVLQFEGSDV